MSERDYIFAKADRAFEEIGKALLPKTKFVHVRNFGPHSMESVHHTPGLIGRKMGRKTVSTGEGLVDRTSKKSIRRSRNLLASNAYAQSAAKTKGGVNLSRAYGDRSSAAGRAADRLSPWD